MPLYRGGYRTVDPTGIGTGSVDATELNYLDGATSNLQSQLDNHVQAVTKGGTNLTSYALGDLIYASATNTLAKLSGNTSVTKQFLSQTGNGTISADPAWSALSAGDIPAGIDAAKITIGTLNAARLPSQLTLTSISATDSSGISLQSDGTTRASVGLNGLVFASGATAAAPGDISIGSDAGSTMTFNVPTGGLYLLGEAATSGVAISAASKYLQFQGSGGILGAAGNAGHCYIAGGNVAANSSCAYIRVYGVSDSSNAGQAVYACGNVAGAKHSFVDSSGTERLKIDETAVTALAPLVTPTATPPSAAAAGVSGQWAWDANFIYICVAANTWRRVAHATW